MAGMTRSGGYSNYNSAGTSKYIPQLYAQKTLKKFYHKTIFNQITNTD